MAVFSLSISTRSTESNSAETSYHLINKFIRHPYTLVLVDINLRTNVGLVRKLVTMNLLFVVHSFSHGFVVVDRIRAAGSGKTAESVRHCHCV